MRKYRGATSRATRETKSLGSAAARLRTTLGVLSAGIAGIGFVEMARQVERATSQMNNIEATMQVATGSANEAAKQIAFIREESQQLGLFFPSVAKQMAQFSAAARTSSITSSELSTIFKGISQASRAMGLSAAQSEGAMMALQQMMSKGKVSAEELRQQLGERMPGSIQIMADALDVTTSKLFEMMENGRLLSDEVLPKFGQEMQDVFGLQAAIQSQKIAAAIQRLRNAFFDLLSQDSLPAATNAIEKLTDVISSEKFGKQFSNAIKLVTNFASLLADNVGAIKNFAVAIGLIGFARMTKRVIASSAALLTYTARASIASGMSLTLTKSVLTLRNAMLSLAASPGGLLIAAAGALTTLIALFVNGNKPTQDYNDTLAETNKQLSEMSKNERDLARATLDRRRAKFSEDFEEFLSLSEEIAQLENKFQEGLSNPLSFVNFQSTRTQINDLKEARSELEDNVDMYIMLTKRINALNQEADMERVTSGAEGLAQATIDANEKMKELAKNARSAFDVIAQYDDDLAESLEHIDQVRDLQDAFEQLGFTQKEAAKKARDFVASNRDVKTSTEETARSFLELKAQFDPAAQSAIEYRDTILDLKEAIGPAGITIDEYARLVELAADRQDEAKKSLEDYQRAADRMGLGRGNQRDLMPPGQRGQVDQRERLLELVEGEALSQEELLEKVIKTGTEGERLYGKWESALRDVGSVIKDDISDGLTDVIMQAESAKDVFEGLLDTIARTITQQQIVDPLVNQVSGGFDDIFSQGPPAPPGIGPQGQGSEGFFSGIGDFFDGFFANGGNVSGGQAHVVGERGPEMFVPRQDGQIVPNSQMGGGGGDVTVNIINQSGEQLQSEQQNKRRGPNGEMTVDVMVKSSMERLDSQGQLDGIFRRHGAKRQGQF